jgi:DNA-binding transcriptional MerR regulator
MSVKSESAEPGLTIDQLAQRVGMTVRNLREWRALGLVPPAEMRGRVGYYDVALVGRIERIRRLQAEGFPLDLIRRLLEASGGAGDEAMDFARALRSPFRDDDPPLADLAELERTWGASSADVLDRAIELGLIRERDDGRHEFTSARVARVGEALHALGLSAEEALDATAAVRAHADGVADVFARVWLTHVWEPFVAAGMPEDRAPAILTTLAEVQPLALDAVIGLFGVAMEAKVEENVSREIERAGVQRQQGGPGIARR